jgi:hypothetical protein
MAHRHVADGGDGLQIWRVAANSSNKQSRQSTMGDPPAWELGVKLTTRHHEIILLRNVTKGLCIRQILEKKMGVQ